MAMPPCTKAFFHIADLVDLPLVAFVLQDALDLLSIAHPRPCRQRRRPATRDLVLIVCLAGGSPLLLQLRDRLGNITAGETPGLDLCHIRGNPPKGLRITRLYLAADFTVTLPGVRHPAPGLKLRGLRSMVGI